MVITAIMVITTIIAIRVITLLSLQLGSKRMFSHYNNVFITVNVVITSGIAAAAIMTISISGIIDNISNIATLHNCSDYHIDIDLESLWPLEQSLS